MDGSGIGWINWAFPTIRLSSSQLTTALRISTFEPDRSRVELYNIPADPMELVNHAKFEETLVKQMSEQVLDWQATLPEGPIDDEAGSNAYPWPGTIFQS